MPSVSGKLGPRLDHALKFPVLSKHPAISKTAADCFYCKSASLTLHGTKLFIAAYFRTCCDL